MAVVSRLRGCSRRRKKLIDQLHGFLSRHEQRLSRACVGQIDDCIRSLEDGSDDFELPDLEPNTSGVTLRFRPGSANPEDPALLDALEEVIYHTVHSGNEAEAYGLYSRRMGGREHLGKVIGEFARGARILRYFRACPNDLDLAWYLRGVGDLARVSTSSRRSGRSGRGRSSVFGDSCLGSCATRSAGSTRGRSRPSSWGGRMPLMFRSTWVGGRPWSTRTCR